MNKKIEYLSIVLISFLVPIITYVFASSYFQKIDMPFENNDIKIDIDKKPLPIIKLLFLGDIMLDRSIRIDGEVYGYDELFSCLEEPFIGYDEVIGNLEGTITNYPSVSKGAAYLSPESFRFTFDKEAVGSLVDLGLSVVSLANNHIRDFGNDGVAQTIENTNLLGLVHFGDPRQGAKRYIVKDVKGTRIAFVPYNEFMGTVEETLEDITTVKPESDFIIVMPHWGSEYVPVRDDVRQIAHSFADAGANLIIGGHPHVIQEIEEYSGVPIYYSLGNFIFDQYWEEAVRKGLMVDITLQNNMIIENSEIEVESQRNKGTCIR